MIVQIQKNDKKSQKIYIYMKSLFKTLSPGRKALIQPHELKTE